MKSTCVLATLALAAVGAAVGADARGQSLCEDAGLEALLEWYGETLARDPSLAARADLLSRVQDALASTNVQSLPAEAIERLDTAGDALTETLRQRYCELGARPEPPAGLEARHDHVVFIIGTTREMRTYEWDRVEDQVAAILGAYPNLQGFQIVGDEGAHLLESSAGSWIPNTRANREDALQSLRNWAPETNGTLTHAIAGVIQSYYDPSMTIAVHVLGDSHAIGTASRAVLHVNTLNRDAATGLPKLQINATLFPTLFDKPTDMRRTTNTGFAEFTREISQASGGALFALPPRDRLQGGSVGTPSHRASTAHRDHRSALMRKSYPATWRWAGFKVGLTLIVVRAKLEMLLSASALKKKNSKHNSAAFLPFLFSSRRFLLAISSVRWSDQRSASPCALMTDEIHRSNRGRTQTGKYRYVE